MQALILAAGRGKRINDISRFQNKCMINLHGKPLLAFHLEEAVKLDVREVIITVGYLAEAIIDHFGNEFQGVPIRYVKQTNQHGLVHAIEVAAPYITDDFLLMLGDEFFVRPDYAGLIKKFIENDPFGVCGVAYDNDPESIRKTYSLLLGENFKIHRLIEKPRKPANSLKGTGVCAFKKEILAYIQYTPVHYLRKEKELPGLIQEAVDDGEDIVCYPFCKKYFNINHTDDLEKFREEYE